jgi:probable rRNA maturation factor
MQPKGRRLGDRSPTLVRPPIHIAIDGIVSPLSRPRAQRVVESVLRAERVPRALISVAFVSKRRISALNREHLGHAGSTDVISFGFAPAGKDGGIVGDIYIAPDVARRNAIERGIPARDELTRLVVHGVLHVVGYGHPEGAGRYESAMWARQEQLVRSLVRRAAAGTARRRSAA